MLDIWPTALVHCKNGMVIEWDGPEQDFWIGLGPEVGYLLFKFHSPGKYLSAQVLPAPAQAPSPLASIRGVLWSRRAALEAERSISAYLAGHV